MAAILSLLASAFSACACSHRGEKVEKTQPSCHSSTHSEPGAELSVTTDADRFDECCLCLTKDVTPAVLAKFETKTLKDQPHAVIAAAQAALETSQVEVVASLPYLFSVKPIHNGQHLPAAPARAPPRL